MSLISWVRLDIPYQHDAKAMRFVAAINNSTAKLSIYESPPLKHLPALMHQLIELEKEGIMTNQDTLLIYPLDDRIALADHIRSIATDNHWQFNRNIPALSHPGVQLSCGFEIDKTGSNEDLIPSESAQHRVFELNHLSQKSFEEQNLLAAFSYVRHALQLSYQHFGWSSPGVAYSLVNFGHLILTTSSNENYFELQTVLNRMLYQWDIEGLDKASWVGAASIFEQLIEIAEQLQLPSYSDRFRELGQNLF